MEEFGRELFGISLARDNSSVVNWDIEGSWGGMISVGIGGPITGTGQGADLLLIDDPVKNRKEADSKTYRDMVWNEYRNTLFTTRWAGIPAILSGLSMDLTGMAGGNQASSWLPSVDRSLSAASFVAGG
ncbi:hypothetical protein [Effusibacillus pohliae]|uniref:hypothetical protein n=1 Tax=Effusibacillus pohliae TaxID=232270 RepID=UPI0003A61EEA|nr:hypothetical protein [Effusibacillus pohliae]